MPLHCVQPCKHQRHTIPVTISLNLWHSEDYATIDNAAVLDGDYQDGSCTSGPTSVPPGWRLADWDANIGLVSVCSRSCGG